MDNKLTTRETKVTESSGLKIPLQWEQKPIWFSGLGFFFLAISLSSIIGFIQEFHDDLFIENWLAWIIAAFFSAGWLCNHWLEILAYRNELKNASLLLLFIALASMFFCFYFEFFLYYPVLRHLGVASANLVMSGFFLRLALFRDESFIYLIWLRNHWLNKIFNSKRA